MGDFQKLCQGYDPANVYNVMDETALYWRGSITRGIGTRNRPGRNLDNYLVALVICTNSRGTDRLPILFVGAVHKLPKGFSNAEIEFIGGWYRYQVKGWMSGESCGEWLVSFYEQSWNDRKAVLLWDNFSGHQLGLLVCPAPEEYK